MERPPWIISTLNILPISNDFGASGWGPFTMASYKIPTGFSLSNWVAAWPAVWLADWTAARRLSRRLAVFTCHGDADVVSSPLEALAPQHCLNHYFSVLLRIQFCVRVSIDGLWKRGSEIPIVGSNDYETCP